MENEDYELHKKYLAENDLDEEPGGFEELDRLTFGLSRDIDDEQLK